MESIFMQMYNRTRTGEGSFNHSLYDSFICASLHNRVKLVRAFPEFFGSELPEFGIFAPDPIKEIHDSACRLYSNIQDFQSEFEEFDEIVDLADQLQSSLYDILCNMDASK